MKITRSTLRSWIPGTNGCVSTSVDSTLTASIWRQVWSLTFSSGPNPSVAAARRTTSHLPYRSSTSSAARPTSSASARSTATSPLRSRTTTVCLGARLATSAWQSAGSVSWHGCWEGLSPREPGPRSKLVCAASTLVVVDERTNAPSRAEARVGAGPMLPPVPVMAQTFPLSCAGIYPANAAWAIAASPSVIPTRSVTFGTCA